MAFDVYTFVTPPSGLPTGTAFTLAYNAGRSAIKYRAAGAHFASAPGMLVPAPSKFTVAFGGTIAITWNGPRLAGGVLVKFQFETVDGQIGSQDRKEIAHASGDNIDLTALGLQPQDSPTFTGTPTAPTAANGTNTTQLSTTAFVQTAIALLVNSSPAALDTLAELATALGNDANFATTMTNSLAAKVAAATANITGTLALSGVITPAQLTAGVDNYIPAGLAGASTICQSTNALQQIGGLQGGAAGRVIVIQNTGAFPLQLLHENAGSTAANRFFFAGGGFANSTNRTLEAGRSIILIYDAAAARWRDMEPLTKALGALLQVGVNDERFLTPKSIFDAAAPVAVAFASTQTLDFSTGINFDLAAASAAFTLANPTNPKIGQSGRIRIPQDATGGRVISYGTWWKAPAGAQALSTAASAVDALYYFVRDATTIEYTLAKAFA